MKINYVCNSCDVFMSEQLIVLTQNWGASLKPYWANIYFVYCRAKFILIPSWLAQKYQGREICGISPARPGISFDIVKLCSLKMLSSATWLYIPDHYRIGMYFSCRFFALSTIDLVNLLCPKFGVLAFFRICQILIYQFSFFWLANICKLKIM